jgi:16S rRNA (guanine1516-N2)-methyltransferase
LENNNLDSYCLVEKTPASLELSDDLKALSISILKKEPEAGNYLIYEDGELKLHTDSGLSMTVDFTENKYQRSFKPSTELLCRACGWHLGMRSVWDLTAGLAVDSMMLAQAGITVSACERNRYLVLLLRQGLRKLQAMDDGNYSYAKNLSFHCIDAEEILKTAKQVPEVIYYDPMYPAKRKTALPSKEMQILRELHGTDGESRELLEAAIKMGAKRVVVKRPLRAPPLIDRPASQISGKLVRFDLYL